MNDIRVLSRVSTIAHASIEAFRQYCTGRTVEVLVKPVDKRIERLCEYIVNDMAAALAQELFDVFPSKIIGIPSISLMDEREKEVLRRKRPGLLELHERFIEVRNGDEVLAKKTIHYLNIENELWSLSDLFLERLVGVFWGFARCESWWLTVVIRVFHVLTLAKSFQIFSMLLGAGELEYGVIMAVYYSLGSIYGCFHFKRNFVH